MMVGDRAVNPVTVASGLRKWFRVQDSSLRIHYHLNPMLQAYYTDSWAGHLRCGLSCFLCCQSRGKEKAFIQVT